jgi:hypothetical protein
MVLRVPLSGRAALGRLAISSDSRGQAASQGVSTVSERPAWGWTTRAMVLTNSWFLSETGRKRPPAKVTVAQIGAEGRTRGANERRGSAEITASCGVADGERR